MAQNRLQAERIDIFNNIRPMSYNVPGHEKRMQELCEQVEREKDKFRVLIRLFYVLFKRVDESIKNAKKSYITSCRKKVLENIKYCKMQTFRDIKYGWT